MVTSTKFRQSIWLPLFIIAVLPVVVISLVWITAPHPIAVQANTLEVILPEVGSNIQQTTPLTATDMYTYYFPVVFRGYRVPTWHAIGLQANDVDAIAIDPSNPRVLYAGVSGAGVYKSTDSGTTWQQVATGLPFSSTVYLIAIDPSLAQNVYVGLTTYPRFYYSENGGQSWSPGGGLQYLPGALAAHPATPRRVYAGVGQFEASGGQIFRSDDGGLNWTEVLSRQVAARSIEIAPQNPHLIYAGGANVYRSEDGGDSWTRIITGLPNSQVWSIAIHPTTPLTAYISMSDGLFKTTNMGDTWSSWGFELPSSGIRKLRVDAHQPKNQYAASHCQGIYASSDEGQHWYALNGGLGNLCVKDLVLDSPSAHLYAATQDGVWVISLINGE